MKIKLEPTPYGDLFLGLPQNVLDVMGWKIGDNVYVDVNGTGSSLVVTRREDYVPVMGGVKEVISGG